jgi:hypothetical protein
VSPLRCSAGPWMGGFRPRARTGRIASGFLLGRFLPGRSAKRSSKQVAFACGPSPLSAVFEALGDPRARGGAERPRRDVKFGKPSTRNWKYLYRGFLIGKQYVRSVVPDDLRRNQPSRRANCRVGIANVQLYAKANRFNIRKAQRVAVSPKSFADLPSRRESANRQRLLAGLLPSSCGDDGNDDGLAAVLSYRTTALPFSGTTTVVACPFISARNLSALGSMIGNEP